MHHQSTTATILVVQQNFSFSSMIIFNHLHGFEAQPTATLA
jgi:hypothetical protein